MWMPYQTVLISFRQGAGSLQLKQQIYREHKQKKKYSVKYELRQNREHTRLVHTASAVLTVLYMCMYTYK